MTPPLFHPNLGVFPLDQIADLESMWAGTLTWNYFRSIPTYVIMVWISQTDDRQTDLTTSHSKNIVKYAHILRQLRSIKVSRHFGPRILRTEKCGSEVTRHFGSGPKYSDRGTKQPGSEVSGKLHEDWSALFWKWHSYYIITMFISIFIYLNLALRPILTYCPATERISSNV